MDGTAHYSLRDLLDVVFRYKRAIVALCFALTAGAAVYCFLTPEIYESEARLLIRRGRENVSVDPSVEGAAAAVVQSIENEVYSELAILQSQQLAEQVVTAVGVDSFSNRPGSIVAKLRRQAGFPMPPPSAERVLQGFVDDLTVEVERKSSIIRATFDAPDRELAHSALDTLVRSYQERHIEVHAAQADPAFFETQVEALKTALAEAEKRLADFREMYGISSLDLQFEALLGQIHDTEDLVNEVSGQIESGQARVASLEQAVRERPKEVELSRTTGLTNWAADDYKKRLAELRLSETDLASRYDASYRPLAELRSQIAALEERLASEGDTHTEVTTGLDDNRKQLELDLDRERALVAAQQARLDVLSTALTSYRERHDMLSARKVELERLERDVALADQAYRKYRESLEESQISVALDRRAVSNVSVVQPATKPIDPIRPNRPRVIALGFLFGLFAGISLAFLLDYLDDSIRTDTDVVRRLRLPVLASIPDDEFPSCT